MIKIKSLTKSFDGLVVIDGITLDVKAGTFVTIIGKTGCGKSTLLNIVAGITEATSGTILSSPKKISYVFQEVTQLLEWRNVLGNVTLPLEIIGVKREERKRRALDTIKSVGLAGYEKYYPKQLSGGMKQKVAIARALVTKPDLILMDEPFRSLDTITRFDFQLDLIKLWIKLSPTIIFVTHDITEGVLLSQKVIVLSDKPSRIKKIFEVDFPYPRSLDLMENKKFLILCKKIREIIKL